MRTPLLILALASLLALVAIPTYASDGEGPTAFADDLLVRIGRPARAPIVVSLIRGLEPEDAEGGVRLAQALGHAGGHAAVRGVGELLTHRLESVRVASLEATRKVGLRSDRLLKTVRTLADEGSERERIEALAALGRVGDGRDMDRLLAAASEDKVAIARAAYEAMHHLTGAQVPFVNARWEYYWKSLQMRASLLLPRAVLALDDAAEAEEVSSLELLVRLYAWTDLEAVRQAAGAWMISPRQELRVVACRLVGMLGLTDRIEDVRSALRFAASPELAEAATAALEALGDTRIDEVATISTREG